jgi:hypothetical protein
MDLSGDGSPESGSSMTWVLPSFRTKSNPRVVESPVTLVTPVVTNSACREAFGPLFALLSRHTAILKPHGAPQQKSTSACNLLVELQNEGVE